MTDQHRADLDERSLGEENNLETIVEVEPEALEAASRAAEQAVEGLDDDARWELFAREMRLALLEDEALLKRTVKREWYLLSLFATIAPSVSRVTELGDWRAVRVGAVPIDEWMQACRDAAQHAGATAAPNQETNP